jgi:hypothetical protein
MACLIRSYGRKGLYDILSVHNIQILCIIFYFNFRTLLPLGEQNQGVVKYSLNAFLEIREENMIKKAHNKLLNYLLIYTT